jgi:RNA polymerase sigma-70 factor (ECF subfamily)
MREAEWEPEEECATVKAAQAGDLRAFDRLAAHYRPMAVLTARRLLQRDQAEDVAQMALLSAYKALPKLRDPERFGPWFAAIVRHQAARMLSRDRSRQEEPLVDHVDRLILKGAPSIASKGEGPDPISNIERLKPEVREVALLYYLDGCPVASIAETLGLSETTVKWRLHVARKTLRDCVA